MADSLLDILSNRSYDEPPESAAIKQFVKDKFQKDVAVTIRDKEIFIEAKGAAFVAALRMQTRQLKAAADTEKRLIFRIA